MDLPLHVKALADDMERQISIESDEARVNWIFQELLEKGEFTRVQKICREWLSRTDREDMIG